MLQKELSIPVFYGTYADLTKFDLSFINAKIVLYKGKKFRECLKLLLAPDIFSYLYNGITFDYDKNNLYENKKIRRYAVIPINIENPFLEKNWYHFYHLILSIYPSDFSLLEIIHLHLYDGKYQNDSKSYYGFKATGEEYFDNFMIITKQEYKFVRNYLEKYFQSSYDLNYVNYILTVFSNSLLEKNPIYQYLSLIICLEVVVDGQEQLSYRLRRNVALLCGNSIHTCKLIYDNVNQLYKLRNAIVHGHINPSYKNFKEYHTYLKTLVARLIRELIVHNIPTITELNERLTTLGYGQNNIISKDYSPSRYPIIDTIHLSYKAIQKYSK